MSCLILGSHQRPSERSLGSIDNITDHVTMDLRLEGLSKARCAESRRLFAVR